MKLEKRHFQKSGDKDHNVLWDSGKHIFKNLGTRSWTFYDAVKKRFFISLDITVWTFCKAADCFSWKLKLMNYSQHSEYVFHAERENILTTYTLYIVLIYYTPRVWSCRNIFSHCFLGYPAPTLPRLLCWCSLTQFRPIPGVSRYSISGASM